MSDGSRQATTNAPPESQLATTSMPYAHYNGSLDMLCVTVDPAFLFNSKGDLCVYEDGTCRSRGPYKNRIFDAVKTIAAILGDKWEDVLQNDSAAMTTLTRAIDSTHQYSEDAPDSPDRTPVIKGTMMNLLIGRNLPRRVLPGETGMFEPVSGPNSMSFLPIVRVFLKDRKDSTGNSQPATAISRIFVTMNGSVQNRETKAISTINSAALQDFTEQIAGTLQVLHRELGNAVELDWQTNKVSNEAYVQTRNYVRELAKSCTRRWTNSYVSPWDVDQARGEGSEDFAYSNPVRARVSPTLPPFDVQFVADYRSTTDGGTKPEEERGSSAS